MHWEIIIQANQEDDTIDNERRHDLDHVISKIITEALTFDLRP